MTKDKALKLALETFEKICEGCGHVIEECIDKSTITLSKCVREDCIKAIDAIKAVLAQPEQAQKQEPLAWMSNESLWSIIGGGNSKGTVPVHIHKTTISNIPLYLTPPQRKWVGLTDEEIDEAVKACKTTDTYKYFRAIEAKLREKNGY